MTPEECALYYRKELAKAESQLKDKDARIAELTENNKKFIENHDHWYSEAHKYLDRIAEQQKLIDAWGADKQTYVRQLASANEKIADLKKANRIWQENLSPLESKLKIAREALEKMCLSHENLYKSKFGEQSNPMDDCVRREAEKALENIKDVK